MKETIIKCPKCDYEYLAGEIFLPKHFLGEPREVERTLDGQILNSYGTPQDLTETYKCDKCGHVFEVTASINYSVVSSKSHNFDDDFVQPLYKNRIHLEEE